MVLVGNARVLAPFGQNLPLPPGAFVGCKGFLSLKRRAQYNLLAYFRLKEHDKPKLQHYECTRVEKSGFSDDIDGRGAGGACTAL